MVHKEKGFFEGEIWMSSDISGFPAVGAVMFLVWAGNQAGLPRKFSPLVAAVLGIILSMFIMPHNSWQEALIQGIFIGASAVGFHSGTKNMMEYWKK